MCFILVYKVKQKQPKYSISLIAMDGLETTKKAADGVLKSKESWELILTDNASTDGTATYFDELAAKNKKIRVIHNEKNEGYHDPHNHALTMANGEYFCILNNDIELPKGWLTKLEQPFKDFPATAAITGPSGSCCCFQAPYPSFHGSPGPNLEYIEGSCLMIPTALAREHTLFAPYLHFAYAEDVDLSLRMRARGLTIHTADFSIVHHRQMTARNIPEINDIQRANHAVMLQRWGNYLKFRKFDLPFIIRRTAAIGDVLLTTPLIAEIKKQSPKSEIFVETNFPDLFKGNPDVTGAGGPFSEIYKWANLIDLNMSYENMPQTSIQEAYFKTANIIGTPGPAKLYPDEATVAKIKDYLGPKKWVGIHAGPLTWIGKQWPFDRWEKLCQRLLEKGWRVLLVGTPGPNLPNYLDLRGKTSFQELAAVMRCCKLFIGLDSFPLHVAQSQGTPVLGLFGATSPEFILTGEYKAVTGVADCAGERHRVSGVTYTPCSGECMNSITVEQVLNEIS